MEISHFNTYLRYAQAFDIDFIEECIINYSSINGIKLNSDEVAELSDQDKLGFYCSYLNNYSDYSQIIIVNRQGRDVAIIVPRINFFKDIAESMVFVSPNACRMAAITAMKALLIYNYLYRQHNSWLTHTFLSIWHPLILMSVQAIHKENQIIVISDNLYHAYCSYSKASMDSLAQTILNYNVVKSSEFSYLFKANL